MSENRGAEGQLHESPWDAASGAFAAWRAGDATAVDDLVTAMTPVLWHVVRAYGHDRQATEDVVPATWLGFVRLHRTIEDPQAVASWLITSARRGAADHAGSRAARRPCRTRRSRPGSPTWSRPRPSPCSTTSPHASGARSASVDERCRRLLRVVAFMERPDYRSLSQELDMPVGSIGPTRARCLAKVRAVLTEQGSDDD